MPPRSYSSKPAPGTSPEEEIISTEGLSFDLDGVTFECHGQLDAQDFIDLATPLVDAGDGWFDPEAVAAVGRFYRLVLGEESHRAFAAHRRRHRTPAPVVAQIMTDLIEEITARPPGSLSRLPAGPPKTAASSPAASPSPVSPPAPAPAAARVASSPAAGGAVDPEGIIPPDWANDVDVVLAPAADPAPPAPEEPVHRTINLGRPGVQVRELTDTEREQIQAAKAN
jgi:hypothetical protein